LRSHEFTVELPQSARRLWALFQRYDLWKEYAPGVLDVEVVHAGDAAGNGLLRHVVYPPLRPAASPRLVRTREKGCCYMMLRTGSAARCGSSLDQPDAAPSARRSTTTPILRWFEADLRYINRGEIDARRGGVAGRHRSSGPTSSTPLTAIFPSRARGA
jgi:hypothetical protein